MDYNKLKWLVIAVVTAATLIFCKCSFSNSQKVERLQKNEVALTNGVKVDSTKHVTSAQTIIVDSKKELNQVLDKEGKQAIEKTDVNAKRLQSVTTMHTETVIKEVVKVDTILIHDTIPAKHFSKTNQWLSIGGDIVGDSCELDIQMRDSLAVVVHNVPKKFLFIRYGTKSVDVDITNSNPYTIIRYVRNVQLAK